MHAVAAHNNSIHDVMNYHEEKLQDGRAREIYGANFIRDHDKLDKQEKLYHFQRLMALNGRIKRNVLHAVLRFGSRENISDGTMALVSKDWLEGMGYGKQPAIGYRHVDTPVPHVHLVSTTVGPDGKRISLTKADLRRSRQLTHQLEKKYGLQIEPPALEANEGRQRLRKVQHGQSPLYPAMTAVLDTVIPHYQYTNLGELNAILGAYNMKASRGSERSITFQRNGLHYLSLKDNGQSTGAYIPASAFRMRPTWPKLQSRFTTNMPLRETNRRRISTAIDFALAGAQLSFTALQQAISRDKIEVVAERNAAGALQKLWYVDHYSKAVFEDKALGEKYLAGAIQQRTLSEQAYQQQLAQSQTQQQEHRIRHSL